MADHPLLSVSVVTPEGAAFEGAAEMLIVPGAAGEIGVLARHAPLVAMLKAGSTRVHLGDGEVREFATGPGFFQVLEDRAIALVDDAVAAGEIDDERARRQLEEAEATKAGLETLLEQERNRSEKSLMVMQSNGDERLDANVRGMDTLLSEREARLAQVTAILTERSPLTILNRGYSITRDASGRILHDAAQVSVGDDVAIHLARGELGATIRNKKL